MADSQKTEQPTPKRLQESRTQGRFPASRELVAGFQFFLFVWILLRDPSSWFDSLRLTLRRLLAAAFDDAPTSTLLGLGWSLATPLVWPALQTGALLVVSALAVHLTSTGFGLAPSRLAPDLSRLSPLSRLSQLPKQNASQLLQALLALPVFAYLTAHLTARHAPGFLRLTAAGTEAALTQVSSALGDVLWYGAAILLLLGLLDYARQRSQWREGLRMTRQEVRDEQKESEGNPQMKARIRRLMRERSRRRMMKDVETATAVVVNPTHFAIALRYDSASMPAPKVVAKGKNFLAARIRDRALHHQVPIVENPPLARALYTSAAVGQEIPAHLFRAVAEVLAYIYRVMNRNPSARRRPR